MPKHLWKGPMWKKRRCYWYDNDGAPLPNRHHVDKKGCELGATCNYAHPEDPQWAKASKSVSAYGGLIPRSTSPSTYGPLPPPPGMPPPPPPGPPPASTTKELPPRSVERVVSASSAHGSDRDRDRDRDSATRSPSRTRYGRPRDTSPGASSIASSSAPRVRKTSSYSSLPPAERRREEERMRYRDEDRKRDDGRRRDDDRRYDDRRRDREDDRRREDERRRRDDRSRERGSRSTSPSRSRRPREVPEEERRRIWMERVKFLTDSVLARGELVRLHEDVLKYERLSKSVGFERLESADKAAMEELIATTKQQAQAKQAELDATLSKLVPSDYYPFVAPPSSRASDAAFDKMTQSLSALRRDVEALFAHVEKLRAAAASITLPPPVAPAATAGPSSKPEAGEIPADRPKKRRRLSIEQSSEPSTQVSDPTAADFDVLKDRLVSLDGRIAGLENDMRQYDNNVADEVEAQLDYRGVSRSLNGASNAELTERYEKLERVVGDAGNSAGDITTGLEQLKLNGVAQDAKYDDLQKENKVLQAHITKLQETQTEMMRKLEEKRNTLEALTAAVTAFISQPPQPPAPHPPSAAEIATTIQPRLLRAVRDDIQPLLSDLQAEIDKLLKDQMNEVNGSLMAQISPTIRAVEAISAWVDRFRQPPAVGNAATTAAPGPSTSVSVDKGKSTARPP
ncbi:hypothetical protein C8T65DRAFT_628260 [Cerioporus squamosus]|nr:hypothetical protein C8T65DRAFT_628260 [Cerioporus squamosus]